MDGELLSLKWNNHRTTFYHVISGLRNKEAYTDVTLACEGKFYPVHKLVLSTCSEYFSDIFERTPCKNPVVVLKDIQCRDIEFLLDYMYIGEVNVRQNELSSLIKAAECLRIKGLAVPDEEPKKVSSNSGSSTSGAQQGARQRPEQPSPPAKRRKADDRRATPIGIEHSPGRPPGDGTPNSPDRQTLSQQIPSASEVSGMRDQHQEQGDANSDIPVQIKVEQDNFETTGQDEYASVQSNNYDDGGGDDGEGPHGSEGNTNDFPEFLQSTVEKEEPVTMSDFNPSDFPGPSGLQNSGIGSWENENSSASFAEGLSGAVAAAVAAASQPQRQQQQLMTEGGSLRGRPPTLTSRLAPPPPHSVTSSSSGSSAPLAGGREVAAGSETFMCPMCRFTTSCNVILSQHMRRHAGGYPFVCQQCDYRTHRSHDLKKHLRTHTGEKPYHCHYCPYHTSDPSNLSAHLKTRHSMIRMENHLQL